MGKKPVGVAFIICDGMTALDFVGACDPISRLKTMGFEPDVKWEICAMTDQVHDGSGLEFVPTRVGGSLDGFDIIIVPGGTVARRRAADRSFVEWLQTAGSSSLKVSVCTGALLLGVAGFLKGKRATSHSIALEELRRYCGTVTNERIVDSGDVITSAGVTAAIDLGLYLCEKISGFEVKEKIRRQMDYPSSG